MKSNVSLTRSVDGINHVIRLEFELTPEELSSLRVGQSLAEYGFENKSPVAAAAMTWEIARKVALMRMT